MYRGWMLAGGAQGCGAVFKGRGPLGALNAVDVSETASESGTD